MREAGGAVSAIHLNENGRPACKARSFRRTWRFDGMATTADPTAVTCKRCLARSSKAAAATAPVSTDHDSG